MRSQVIATVIFLLTYIGIALGSVPGLAIDRTAIALIGAVVMLTTHILNEREAFRSIDARTILLLYSLMVLSAQFTLSGLYARIASGVFGTWTSPRHSWVHS
jgi:di/tricarboxylate transporter